LKCIFAKKIEMKYLLIIALVYILFKYNTLKSQLSSLNQNAKSKINKNESNQDDEGEYIDYEEVD